MFPIAVAHELETLPELKDFRLQPRKGLLEYSKTNSWDICLLLWRASVVLWPVCLLGPLTHQHASAHKDTITCGWLKYSIIVVCSMYILIQFKSKLSKLSKLFLKKDLDFHTVYKFKKYFLVSQYLIKFQIFNSTSDL